MEDGAAHGDKNMRGLHTAPGVLPGNMLSGRWRKVNVLEEKRGRVVPQLERDPSLEPAVGNRLTRWIHHNF